MTDTSLAAREPITAVLSKHEARSLTDEVKRDGERLWRKLVELYDGQAHTALGYASWHSYCEAEFDFKQAQAYRLLHAGQVNAIIQMDNATLLTESHARELAPLRRQPEKVRDAWTEASADGEPTAVKVREAVGRQMGVHYSSETPEWSTPQDLFDELHSEFEFELDVCATADNAKCERYFSVDQNGLEQEWRGVCWMNPPYGDAIKQWVTKAHESALAGATVACLVPARVDTGWWWDHCRYGEIRFLRGRLKFGGGDTSAPFPSAVVIFPNEPKVVWWER
jgi:phage N-6-adenine-methyltransferase